MNDSRRDDNRRLTLRLLGFAAGAFADRLAAASQRTGAVP